MVTLKPLDWRSLPNEAEMIPFPNEEVTPPVTKMYFVVEDMSPSNFGRKGSGFGGYP